MKKPESRNWLLASDLLEEILQLPDEEQASAARQLGAAAGVEVELESLFTGLSQPSCLDDTLDEVFCQIPAVSLSQHSLRGQQFGRWVLGDEIGRGGMSVVYRATRSGDGFEQNAAFKILSVAFLNDQHVESFLKERKILSELTHPGIARMIDGGVTPDGAPYLVMEEIEGDRIDLYCRNKEISVKQVVRLIEQLCRAVAHAHRHLVVHRDVNPSNVLIDQRGRPILVDFGIAKILGDAETGRTLLAFTPEYAAPEQRLDGQITTATDVYGLGMTLTKLLDTQTLDRGLGSIIHVATHEDADLRYTTAKSMGDDLLAWLENRPVRARPDSWSYRVRMFSVRHWRWLSIAFMSIIIAIAGIISTSRQAEISRQEAGKHRAVADFMLGMFKQADLMQSGADLRVTELLESAALHARDDLAGQPAAEVSLLTLIASGQIELTNYESAANVLERAGDLIDRYDIPAETRSAYMVQRGRESYELGQYSVAVQHLQTALELLDSSTGRDNEYYEVAATLVSYMVDSENYDEARTLAEQLVNEVGQGDANTEALIHVTHRYAVALEVTGDIEPAFSQYQRALQLQQEFQPDNQLGRAAILQDFGIAYYFAGQYADSEAVNREVLQIFNVNFESPHPRISSALHNLAFSIVGQERLDEAIELLKKSYEMSAALHGTEHIDTLLEQATLGSLMGKSGDYAGAEPILRENIANLERVAPEMLVQRGSIHSYLGDVLLQTKRLEESRLEYLAARELFNELPDDHVRMIEVNERLEEIATASGNP